jgi:hypothetical protein
MNSRTCVEPEGVATPTDEDSDVERAEDEEPLDLEMQALDKQYRKAGQRIQHVLGRVRLAPLPRPTRLKP